MYYPGTNEGVKRDGQLYERILEQGACGFIHYDDANFRSLTASSNGRYFTGVPVRKKINSKGE